MAASLEPLPAAPGSYALHLRLAVTQSIQVGRLGRFRFPVGDYVYLGSAQGPGGLRARLGRHLIGGGRLRWHIDYLRAAAEVSGVWWVLAPAQSSLRQPPGIPLECRWSQVLAALAGAFIPVVGFGSSDCISGCQAHLVGFLQDPLTQSYKREEVEALLNNCVQDEWDVQPPLVVKWLGAPFGVIRQRC